MREVNITWKPSKKQLECFNLLEDKETTEVLYGGSAGCGKSYLGCVWLILNCLRYEGSRWLIGRAELKALKASTILTFFQICKSWGLIMGEDFKYNQIDGVITFLKTGSTVFLKDLKFQPSDPEFSDLGSREYSGVFIDEGAEVTEKAFNITKSRIRYKLEEFNIIPKILICSNPIKNFLYRTFYKANRDGTLPLYRKFLPALVIDNPFISPHYIDNLKKLDKISKQRLLYGVWEYDEDQTALFVYEDILNIFTQVPEVRVNRTKYLSCDIARFGEDKTCIMLWENLYVLKIYVFQKQDLLTTTKIIQDLMDRWGIPKSHVIVDEDGLGGGVVDTLKCQGFINNARALELKTEQNPTSSHTVPPRHNFANLKTQCYFYLAKMVIEKKIGIYPAINDEVKTMLIEDLEQIRQANPDKDMRLSIVPKEQIKESLGRSTDFSDALMMRMYYQIKPPYKPMIALF